MNYPNGHHKKRKIANSLHNGTSQYANRGMTLENDINETNNLYLETNKAIIHKKPTPVQIVKVDYPKRSAAVIKEAYFKQASTTDYNGLYKGKYIDFEAKETKSRTSIPLANIHEHQVQHMRSILEHGGICFLIIRYALQNETFLLPATSFLKVWEEQFQGGRKSISINFIRDNGYVIPFRYPARVDYLSIVDKLYF
ncbi:Holliday junction resolvase RecU [Salirhabdus salicampi]|uniref:Holliday junction resolvase RecU n=1 Tax=Salirhabdus salicampi TaxID=476102 RepID=UPI0020C4CA56|nr:Holliday junction resolvase RecU [Salirhabdus salicampi]MCP8616663.1 Holliday junction resolvase RecU [Salirhabdus salicampi]